MLLFLLVGPFVCMFLFVHFCCCSVCFEGSDNAKHKLDDYKRFQGNSLKTKDIRSKAKGKEVLHPVKTEDPNTKMFKRMLNTDHK